MKKLLSLFLGCIIALTLTVSALAAPFYLEPAGVTIDVPEGMTAQDLSTEESYVLGITVDADANLKYAYSLNYIEEFEGKYLEDLTDEEGEVLLQGITASIADPQFDTAEVGDYKLLVVASGDALQLHYISLLNGWLCDIAVGRADGALTEEDIKMAAQLLISIQFDEGDAEVSEEVAE